MLYGTIYIAYSRKFSRVRNGYRILMPSDCYRRKISFSKHTWNWSYPPYVMTHPFNSWRASLIASSVSGRFSEAPPPPNTVVWASVYRWEDYKCLLEFIWNVRVHGILSVHTRCSCFVIDSDNNIIDPQTLSLEHCNYELLYVYTLYELLC